MNKLKPCPLCGGKVKLLEIGFQWEIICKNCNLTLVGQGLHEICKETAIKKWNRRAE